MVAIATACSAGSAVGSPVVTFCSLAARSISSNRSKSLLLPAGPSVPSPTGMPSASMLHHRRDAAREFHVARRAVRDARAARFQDRHVGVVHPDAVRGDGAAVQNAQRVEQPRSGVMWRLAQRVVVLLLGLGEVDQQRRVVFVGERARGFQGLVVSWCRCACGATAGTISGSLWKRCEELLGEAQRVGGRRWHRRLGSR